jgi:hypothetical protein
LLGRRGFCFKVEDGLLRFMMTTVRHCERSEAIRKFPDCFTAFAMTDSFLYFVLSIHTIRYRTKNIEQKKRFLLQIPPSLSKILPV